MPRVSSVFLDRDGTLNVKAPEGGYITGPGQLRMLPLAAKAVAQLKAAGLATFVVTNQRGVALGQMTSGQLDAVHDRLATRIAAAGGHLDGIFVCTHQRGTCSCRKPEPGLMCQAREAFPWIRFDESLVIGDSVTDVELGRRVGAKTFLLSKDGRTHSGSAAASAVFPSLWAATRWLLLESGWVVVPRLRKGR